MDRKPGKDSVAKSMKLKKKVKDNRKFLNEEFGIPITPEVCPQCAPGGKPGLLIKNGLTRLCPGCTDGGKKR